MMMSARSKCAGAFLAAALSALSCTNERRVGILIDNMPPSLDAGAPSEVGSDPNIFPDDAGSVGGDDGGMISPADGAVDSLPAVHFSRIAAGNPLPDEATCAALVRRGNKEQRTDNTPFNKVLPTAAQIGQLSSWGNPQGFAAAAMPMGKRVSGNFTGTTDEILQWAACKWGFDEDFVRADSYQANGWHQGSVSGWTTTTSLCPSGGPIRAGMGGSECAQVFGLFGLTWQFHKSAWPMIHDSTPFTVDYSLALQRVCFEGWDSYFKGVGPAGNVYGPNDEFGCAASFYTGGWYDFSTIQQVNHIRDALSSKPWTSGN
jgi:autotransporter family porin